MTLESYLTFESQFSPLSSKDENISFNKDAVSLYCHHPWQQLEVNFLGTEMSLRDFRELCPGRCVISNKRFHSPPGFLTPSCFDVEPQCPLGSAFSGTSFPRGSDSSTPCHWCVWYLLSWPYCVDGISWKKNLQNLASGINSWIYVVFL